MPGGRLLNRDWRAWAARWRRDPALRRHVTVTVLTLSVALLSQILSPEPVAAQEGTSNSPPPAPDPPTVYDNGLNALTVTWTEPDNAEPAVTGYDLEYRRRDSSDWLPGPQDQTGTSATITELKPDKNYYVRVRAQNGNGPGDWSEAGEGTTALYVGTMTVGDKVAYRGYRRRQGEPYGGPNSPGELVPRAFTYDGDEYRIITMAWCMCIRGGAGGLHSTAIDLYSLFHEIPDEWVLRVGDLRLLLADTERADLGRTGLKAYWPHLSPGWVTGRQYEVSFSRNPLRSSAGRGVIRGPLTAELSGVPNAHNGTSAFRFTLSFSEDVKNRRDDILGAALTVVGGSITDARQDHEASHRVWRVTVQPDGAEAISITLQADRDCATDGAVCTEDGRRLTQTITKSVRGPQPPVITGQSHFSLAENDTIVVGRFTASDPDSSRLTWQPPTGVDAALFTMDGSGNLRFLRAPDFEAPADSDTDNVYEVTVRVSDGLQLARHDVTVAVTDQNERPIAVDDEARTLEDEPVTIDVLSNDSDPDAGDTLSPRVVSAQHGTASIGHDRTVLFTPASHYHGDARITYEIVDAQGLAARAAARIEIEPVNDPPRFPSVNADRAVSEAAEQGDSVGSPVKATDIDGHTLTYRMVGPPEFTIEPGTGQIRVAPDAVLDSATRDSYVMRVEADDGNGGSADIVVTITVQQAPIEPRLDRVTLAGGGGGGGGSPPAPVPSDEEFDWNLTRDLESLAREQDEPTGMWSDGATLWVVDNASTGPDRVYAYDLATGEQQPNHEFELDSRNRFSHGIWSDGAIAWIADSGQDRLFAYNLRTGERLVGQDVELHESNRDPRGIWSDGETLYALDSVRDAIFAYDLKSAQLLAEYSLDSLNRSPRGIWSDGVALWVSDDGANRLFAYELVGGVLRRNEAEEFSFRSLLKAGNSDPRGIWSDGDVMYVVDSQDDRVYSYNMPDRTVARLDSLSLGEIDFGDFSPFRLAYSATVDADTSTATVLAEASEAAATLAIQPEDADGDESNGHEVSLGEVTRVAIAVTSSDGSRVNTYEITVRRRPCLVGLGAGRISEVTFSGGSLEALERCAETHSINAFFYWTGESWLLFGSNLPDFLTRAFRQTFANGIAVGTTLIAAVRGQPEEQR